MKATAIKLVLVSTLALLLVLILAGRVLGLGAEPPRETVDCSVGKVIEVATGWSIDLAKKRSPALALTETPGFDVGLSAYVYRPGVLKYVGGTQFTVTCPHMVSVTPKNGKVGAITIQVAANDPYDFEQAMKLMAAWRDKFAAMGLDSPSESASRTVEPFDAVAPFFHLPAVQDLSPIGKSTGAWQGRDEIIFLGIERMNVAPLNQPHKFIYVVEISVDDKVLWPVE
ncbi:hypothetical protein [Dyella sp. Tek66A03]|uniref:hypothetical protein n=1 Tax=Dyella sp. Tek66A03 TaxID=3458298 RepID=UPI00403E83BE